MLKYQWTNGTTPQRSLRKKDQIISLPGETTTSTLTTKNETYQDPMYSHSAPKLTPTYQQSCHQISSTSSTTLNEEMKNREDSCIKMGEREMISQIGQNPFFSGNLNYADQLAIQDKYLKPISSVETNKGKLKLS